MQENNVGNFRIGVVNHVISTGYIMRTAIFFGDSSAKQQIMYATITIKVQKSPTILNLRFEYNLLDKRNKIGQYTTKN